VIARAVLSRDYPETNSPYKALIRQEETSMSDQGWDVLEFVERFRNCEFDTRMTETLDSLSPEQIESSRIFSSTALAIARS